MLQVVCAVAISVKLTDFSLRACTYAKQLTVAELAGSYSCFVTELTINARKFARSYLVL